MQDNKNTYYLEFTEHESYCRRYDSPRFNQPKNFHSLTIRNSRER